MQIIENENSRVTITDEPLFIAEYKDKVVLSKDDLAIVVKNYDDLSNGELWKVLHIFPKETTVSSEGRDYAESREKPAKAEAFVIESLSQRILFKFYRKFRSVNYPMKEFSNREDAMTWLNKF